MDRTIIEREFDAYRRADKAAQDLLDRADSEQRALTPEEESQFDAAFEAAGKHKERADKLVKQAKDAEEVGEALRALVGNQTPEGREDRGGDASLLDNIRAAQSAIEKGTKFGEVYVEQLVDLEKRAIADFSDNGALYTTDFATKVAVYQRTASPWINLASVINANNGRPLNLPNLTVDPTTYTPGEGTAITENSGTIGSAALTTTAYKALSYISAEAEEDELVGILGIIAKAQGRQLGLSFGSALTAALLTAMTNGGTAAGTGGNGTAASTFFGYEDLIDLKMSLAAPYRQNGVWVMANTAIKKVRKFKDQNSFYFYQAASNPQTAATFDGDPIYEDPYLAAVASATKSVVYGDPSAVVVKQMALRVATSTEFHFSQDQVALRSVYRAGGALPDAIALKYLVSANT